MAHIDTYLSQSIPDLAKDLAENYYNLKILCNKAADRAKVLEDANILATASPYIGLSLSVINKTKEYINWQEEVFRPYMVKLTEKVETSHDCSNCSGKCQMEHMSQVPLIMNYHSSIKEALYKLNVSGFENHSGISDNNQLQLLYNDIVLIENSITELFDKEKDVLIPKIVAAQKNINVLS